MKTTVSSSLGGLLVLVCNSNCERMLWIWCSGIILTVPEGPDGLRMALTKEPAPPEEALVMESEDLLPDLCRCFSLQRNESPS